MRTFAAIILALAVVGGVAAQAQAGDADDCRSISDSVYGSWGCR
jgi:hypothetical protein